MFIDLENHPFLRELFKSETRDELLTPEEGFIIGNMFFNLYHPYKHYKPRKITPKNEQEALKLKIQELSFAVNDLVLYLDLYPEDQRCLKVYKDCLNELRKECNLYSEKYEPLMVEEDLKEGFNWIKSPWPWEGKHV